MVGFYSNFISSGDLCFDIGANMGNRTEAFLKLGAQVVAVEPQEQCLCTLRKKFQHNSKLTIIDKALDETEGEAEFFISSAHTLSSMSSEWVRHVDENNLFQGSTWSDRITVRTTTLNKLVKTHGVPVFCKIDVEGFEYDVLAGLSQPLDVISFEFTQGFIESTKKCINHLAELGPAVFNYSEGESMTLSLGKWVDANEITEIMKDVDKSVPPGDIYVSYRKETSNNCNPGNG